MEQHNDLKPYHYYFFLVTFQIIPELTIVFELDDCLNLFSSSILFSPPIKPSIFINLDFLLQILGVEMLSVLHRVLLTRDSRDIHLAAMRVARQIVKAAQESLEGKKAAAAK